jgi:hypothetical protein
MVEDKSALYRNKANELRTLAERSASQETRRRLHAVAMMFDRLAELIRSREPERQVAD